MTLYQQGDSFYKPLIPPTRMAEWHPDLAGQREQILSNAAYLFTRVVEEHMRTYRTSIVKPNEIFDIVIQKDGWTSYKAILICGDPAKRTLAASGKSQWTTSGALEALLKLLSKAIAKEGRALRFDERDLQRTSDGVMNENLM